jgi:ubiquinone/menaquinone biosynthesis C-methylase UbiE
MLRQRSWLKGDDHMAKGHRGFAAVWSRQTAHESETFERLRERVATGVSGRVLEVGVGVGSNWRFLPQAINYVGIDPDEFMLERARERANRDGRNLTLEPHDVQQLPYEDASFDSVMTTLTFCSVPNARKGLAEVRRVLTPDGEFRFWEHVRSDNRLYAFLQSFARPLTRLTAGGCEHNRETLAAIRDAGFQIVSVERTKAMGMPMVCGVAKRQA